jgi:hypothetical protein
LRLPSDAEWEYACRAGTVTRYWSGDSEEDLKRVGWYSGNSGDRLHAVGEKEANPFGLYDMHGNVNFDSEIGGFDESALTTFQQNRQILEVREHFFLHNELPVWTLLISYRDEERMGERTREMEHGKD